MSPLPSEISGVCTKKTGISPNRRVSGAALISGVQCEYFGNVSKQRGDTNKKSGLGFSFILGMFLNVGSWPHGGAPCYNCGVQCKHYGVYGKKYGEH